MPSKSPAQRGALSKAISISMNEPSSTSTTATRIAVEQFEAAVLKAAERAAAQAAEARALEEAVDALRKK